MRLPAHLYPRTSASGCVLQRYYLGRRLSRVLGKIMQGIVSRTPYLLFAYTPCGADAFSCHIQPVIYNMYPSVPYGQSFPYKPWHKPPKEYDYPVSPIHGADRFTPFDGADNPFRYLSGAHQQRVFFIVAQQIRIYKTGTYVGEPYPQTLHSRQLLECLDVDVLETFGRRISRGSPQAFCARYRTDDGDMPFALLTEIAVCRINHADKAQHVCLCR